jgi:hypothetical protein
MPAYLTHRAAGEEVYGRLNKTLIPVEKAFYLGCQGPDLLFYKIYKPWRSCRKSLLLAVRMHREKTRELLAHALEFLKTYEGKDRDELLSYIAGFLTHYTIDKNTHPFVYGKAGSDASIHNATESMWDSFTAKEKWGIEPEQFDIYSEVMYGKVGSGICEWYSSVAENVYNADLSGKAVSQAQCYLAKAKKKLANIHLAGKILLKLISCIIGFDLKTMMYPEERNDSLFSGEEYSSMLSMFKHGVDEACDMTKFMLEYISGLKKDLPDWFGVVNFAGEKENPLQAF